MPKPTQNPTSNPDVLAEQFLSRIGDQRVVAMRSEIWRLTNELAMVRGMLPDAELLDAAANILDRMVPDDPDPQVQRALRDWASRVRYIGDQSTYGAEAFEAMKAALAYEDAASRCAVMADPDTVRAAREAHAAMLAAIKQAKPLFKREEPRHDR